MRNFIFFLLFAVQVSAQEYVVKKGVVIDSLKVTDSLNESFSLYLPTNYSGEKNWPTIYLFDTQGRGKAAAQLFKSAAEDQGYMIISSNDISPENDLLENLYVADRLVRKTAAALPVDPNQISSAGTMDGAKVATSIPFIFTNVHGVIAVGNQWMNSNLLDAKNGFVFIGVVGDEHHTAASMKLTANVLKKMKFPSFIYTYEGEKEWPNTAIINSAVGSLTLEAMKEGLRPVNQQLIQKLYANDISIANERVSKVKLVEAHSFLEMLEEKYQGLRGTGEVEDKLEQVERSRNYQEQSSEIKAVFEKENRLLTDFFYYLEEDIYTENFDNLGWWNYQKIQLDSLSARGGAEGKMAKRIQNYVSELAVTHYAQLEENHASLEKKLLANMIATIFDPKNYPAYRKIITLSAQDNDFGTALFYLEEMLKHGYRNFDEVYNIEGTLGLKLTPEFNSLIEKYLGRAKFPTND